MRTFLDAALTVSAIYAAEAQADWRFNASPSPDAFIQAGDMTLELQCDRMRFAPAGYEDAQDIERRQGLSIRFMKDGATEAGAFQAGAENADIRIVNNFPVKIVFHEKTDYGFVLDEIGKNAVLKLAKVDGDVSYGIFDLTSSGAAIKSLRAACAPQAAGTPASVEAPEGVVYCGGGAIKRRNEYRILEKPANKWDARVTVNGETIRAMTAYSYFGKSKPPRGFVVALLGEDRSEFLVFKDGDWDWLEYGDYAYRGCDGTKNDRQILRSDRLVCDDAGPSRVVAYLSARRLYRLSPLRLLGYGSHEDRDFVSGLGSLPVMGGIWVWKGLKIEKAMTEGNALSDFPPDSFTIMTFCESCGHQGQLDRGKVPRGAGRSCYECGN